MNSFLGKRWFLLVILGGVLSVWLWPEGLRWTAYFDPGVCGGLAVFLSSWGLPGRSLWTTLLKPWPALWALVISYGLLPTMAWFLAGLLNHPDLRIGLILIASVPCTLASAVIWTRLARGNEASALLITLLTNATSWLITTGWLMLATGVGEGGLAAPELMVKLALVLLVPVVLGQLVRTVGTLARFADRHTVVLGVGARLLTVTIMLKAALEVRDRLGEETVLVGGWLLVLAAFLGLVVHLGALVGGLASSRILGFSRPDQIAVAIGGSQKTLPVALILFDAYFTDYPLAVVPVVFFHVGQLIADTFIAEWLAGQWPGEPDSPTPGELAGENLI